MTALIDSAAPAAGIAVELGHHDPVEVDDLGELLGDIDRVLAGHRVDDQQDVVRRDGLLDLGQLGHQLGVDVQTAAGVDNQHILALGLGPLESPLRDRHGARVGALFVDRRSGLVRRP